MNERREQSRRPENKGEEEKRKNELGQTGRKMKGK